MNNKETARDFLSYIKKATSPFHAVLQSKEMLKEAGFEELNMREPWVVAPGGKYFIIPYGTCLFAFTVGDRLTGDQTFHIAAAHTDHPCLHIKPVAEMSIKGYLKVNTEVYGGPILNTWMDRPLSIAGRVALRSKNVFQPELRMIDIDRALLTIPNLAIHMNREVNKGVELSKQTDMIPLLGMINDKLNENSYFVDFIASELGVQKEEILDFDLYIYNKEEGCFTGMQEEFVSSPRIDNLSSCFALTRALISENRSDGINLIALYDNEEIGSLTKQGADSALLSMLLTKIYAALGYDEAALKEAILRSFLISVDVAHAMHPNRMEKYDATNFARLNDGVTIKINSNQKYTFDTEAVAILQQLCEKAEVPYKKFVNHSDMAGGGTLGPIISSWLPMKTVDIGIPILAMHSARELMGTEDISHLENLAACFFMAEE